MKRKESKPLPSWPHDAGDPAMAAEGLPVRRQQPVPGAPAFGNRGCRGWARPPQTSKEMGTTFSDLHIRTQKVQGLMETKG